MNKKSKNALLLVVLLAIVGIAVGYAALSQELVLNGTATVKGSSDWDVHFVNGAETAANGEGAEGATIAIDDGYLTGTFSATFEPGGVATYTVKVVNDGSIPAEYQNYEVGAVTGDASDYITCQVTPGDITTNLVDGSNTHTFTITLTCADMDELPDTEIEAKTTVTFNYKQATVQESN